MAECRRCLGSGGKYEASISIFRQCQQFGDQGRGHSRARHNKAKKQNKNCAIKCKVIINALGDVGGQTSDYWNEYWNM